MKKTILIALFSVALIAMMCGCDKCETCTTTASITINGVPMPSATSTTTQEVCGSDIKDVDGKNIVNTQQAGGSTYVTTAKTTCK